jgi:ABC-type phosphate transport system substrate-binding protein
MRKLIIAATTAAALCTLGLGATAAQASPNIAKTTASNTTVVAGIAASTTVTFSSSEKCTKVKVTGLPGSVTAGTASSVKKGCEVEVEGVWPKPGSHKVTFAFTASGKTTTSTETFTVLSEPCENDAVGVGSDTITPLTDQLASDHNNTLKARTSCSTSSKTNPYEYSWDAVNPITGAIGDSIPEKADCPSIARPDGSSAGIAQLATFTKSSSGPLCTNFARSSRTRASTDPPYAAGGIAFVALAGDAVTWSTPSINTFAPASLDPTQLTQIWSCTVPEANNGTGENQWGDLNPALTGSAATTPIAPFLPQSGSGTLSFWETAIGVTTPGPCVSNNNNMLEENEGVNPALNTNPGTIFIYSVGDYIAQVHHAAKCLNSTCTANSSGVICKKTPNLDQFWCNEHGTMSLGEISGVAPTTGSGTKTKINPAFPSTFDRTLFNVVPYDPNTTDHIPGSESGAPGGLDLESLLGATGYDCTSATAKADIKAYGFVPLSTCGSTS